MQIHIVSPYTHLNGHYWPYTTDFIHALLDRNARVSTFASREPRHEIANHKGNLEWRSCCSWTELLLSDNYRSLHWGSRLDSFLRNLEFLICLNKAMSSARRNRGTTHHIHCIESRHRLLARAVIHSDLSFSTLCVGEPDAAMSASARSQYKRAFATGRLTFIVETEQVRQAWEELAGQHVIHIPAALPWASHRPLTQSATRARFGLPQSALICLFFGTHREGKDYQIAIEAAKMSASVPFLWFAGPLISGNDPVLLLEKSEYPNARCWNGYVPDEDVGPIFDACDIVVLPYANGYVKGSAVLLQACYFRKPVIATNTGHLREFVVQNQNGLLFDMDSAASLAAIFDELTHLKNVNRLESRFTFERPDASFSWNKLIGRYLQIFDGKKSISS